MKLPDINLLIYSADASSPHYERSRLWLVEALSGTEEVGFAWLALVGFVRIATSQVVFGNPLSITRAFEFVDSWLGSPVATVVHPGARHADVLHELLGPLGTAGNLTNDAHLAALAIEHGAELCSADVDFSRFTGLRWTNPLRER